MSLFSACFHQKKIGYARVSTEDQKLTIQLEALKKAGCTRIFREKVSGAYRDRPELNRMLDQLCEGVRTAEGFAPLLGGKGQAKPDILD